MANYQEELVNQNGRIVQFVLRAGLFISIALMLIGLILNLVSAPVKLEPIALFDLFSQPLTLANRLMGLGVFILALTPAARVVMLLILWLRERDWKFVSVASIVIVTLLLSIFIGSVK